VARFPAFAAEAPQAIEMIQVLVDQAAANRTPMLREYVTSSRGSAGLEALDSRTDAKVRAHVALCMLALYIQRSLAWQLRKENISAEQALEQLEPCRLCRYVTKGSGRDAYVLPQISAEDRALLRRLGLTRRVEPGELRAALRPRSEFVSTSADETA